MAAHTQLLKTIPCPAKKEVMPKLTFLQLVKVFAAGLFGYLVILITLSLMIELFFPHFMRSVLDFSPREFLKLPIFFGVVGTVLATISLIAAWCFTRVFSKNEKRPNCGGSGDCPQIKRGG